MKKKPLLKYPYKFAVIGGAFWGLTLFLLTLIAMATGYGQAFLSFVAGIYPNYSLSFSGALIGLFFGFMDGFIICFLVAFFGRGKKKGGDKKDK